MGNLPDTNIELMTGLSAETHADIWEAPVLTTLQTGLEPPIHPDNDLEGIVEPAKNRRRVIGGVVVMAVAGTFIAGMHMRGGGADLGDGWGVEVAGDAEDPGAPVGTDTPTTTREVSINPVISVASIPETSEVAVESVPTISVEATVAPTTQAVVTEATSETEGSIAITIPMVETTAVPTTIVATTTLAPTTTVAPSSSIVSTTELVPTTILQVPTTTARRLATVAGNTFDCDAPTVTIEEGMYISLISEACNQDLMTTNNFCNPNDVPVDQEVSLQPGIVLDVPCASSQAVSTQSSEALPQPENSQTNVSSGDIQYDVWLSDFCATAGGSIVEAISQRSALAGVGISDPEVQDHILYNTTFLQDFSLEIVGSKPECVPDSWEDVLPYLP